MRFLRFLVPCEIPEHDLFIWSPCYGCGRTAHQATWDAIVGLFALVVTIFGIAVFFWAFIN